MTPSSTIADSPTGRLEVWVAAMRPKTLPAAIAPVLVGTALAAADGALHAGAAVAALVGALLIQIGTNLANDYSDWRRGADNDTRLGPARATQQGWLSPRTVAGAAALCFGLAALVGLYLVSRAGWPLVAIGLVSIACGIAYTGGPLPFGYFGLGDLAVLVFFGPIAVCGTYYVQALRWSSSALLASVGVGALITAILVVNNIRDRESDRRAGKHTLAVRLGLCASRWEYATLLLLPYALIPLAVTLDLGRVGWYVALATLPLALIENRKLWQRDGAELNASLASTARLSLLYSASLALGVLI
jgi:1,4-dihydroxy-2-naphthoate octaprenyltransferase